MPALGILLLLIGVFFIINAANGNFGRVVAGEAKIRFA